MYHQRYPQGFFIVRPFSGETAIPEIIAIVGGVDNHRILRKSLFFQFRYKPSDDMINSANHAKVSAHVGLVLLRGIPPPKKALPVDRCFKEVWLGFVNYRIVEGWKRHLLVFVHPVGDLRPWEMSDTRSLVAIFSMRGVEADLQAEGLIFGLFL